MDLEGTKKRLEKEYKEWLKRLEAEFKEYQIAHPSKEEKNARCTKNTKRS